MARRKQSPRDARGRRLVTVLAGGLAAAAMVANLPAVHEISWSRPLLAALIWLSTVAVFRLRRDLPGMLTPALAVIALFALAAHVDFGRFHGRGHYVHEHEFFHYYAGSKYFRELGFDGLYVATYAALVENDPGFAGKPFVIRNLRSYRLEGKRTYEPRAVNAASVFTASRWEAFRRDIRFFETRIPADAWQLVFADYGYNPTPFWTMLGGALSSRIPAGPAGFSALALLDVVLFAVMLMVARRIMGTQPALLLAIFLFANPFAPFDITGGAFLRQLWLAALIVFIAAVVSGRTALAGVALAIATLDRVFPVFFALVPAALFVRETCRRRSFGHPWTRFAVAFPVALLALAGASALATGGVAAWRGFIANIAGHEGWFFSNALSLRNIFTVNPATLVHYRAAGWDEAAWLRERETLAAAAHVPLAIIAGIFVVMTMTVAFREREPVKALALASFLPFFLLYPADYYATGLAPVVLAAFAGAAFPLIFMGLMAALWVIRGALPPPLDTNVEFAHWAASAAIAVFAASWLIRELVRGDAGAAADGAGASRQPVCGRGMKRALAACAILVPGAIAGDLVLARRSSHADRSGVIDLDLTTRDIAASRGTDVRPQAMLEWGSGWANDDHLALLVNGPSAEAHLDIDASRTGVTRVKVLCTTSPTFGVLGLSVNDGPEVRADLYSPRVGLRALVLNDIALRRGRNDFAFSMRGKNPASSGYHAGLDRILIIPGVAPGREEALDHAVGWIRDHPADAFDGGRGDMACELTLFVELASRASDERTGERFRQEARACASRIDALSAERIPDADFVPIARAALAAAEIGIPLRTAGALAARMDRVARRPALPGAAYRPIALAALLDRLDASGAPRWDPAESILAVEYERRELTTLIEREVDRARIPAITITLQAMCDDAEAMRAAARGPGGAARPAFMRDRAFWTGLLDDALRWGVESGDELLTARIITFANVMEVPAGPNELARRDDAQRFLLNLSEPDGGFGPATPSDANPTRRGVIAAVRALAPGGLD